MYNRLTELEGPYKIGEKKYFELSLISYQNDTWLTPRAPQVWSIAQQHVGCSTGIITIHFSEKKVEKSKHIGR